MPLILEPEKWERPALLELAEQQNANLSGILDAFTSGLVTAPDTGARDAAIDLLRVAIDVHDAARSSPGTDLTLVRLVNLQYQTMLTVTVLVPPTLLAERLKRQKESKDRALAARSLRSSGPSVSS
jgi:hypothetical protein